MTIHYHGTPITPQARLHELAGRNFCVSYASYERGGPNHMATVHRLAQSVMLDNGAFTFWRTAPELLRLSWDGFYDWAEPWLEYHTTWAVIPDVIDGTEEENDLQLAKWFQRRLPRGAPVWHMHESIERLQRLCVGYERVCIGSSGMYATVGSPSWHRRMEEAMNAICGNGPAPVWLHMLRGMAMVDAGYPFASVDSTDIAQNHNRPQNTPLKMAQRWDGIQSVPRWRMKGKQLEMEPA